MPFTYECGICHAVYRLDENQVTVGGVKITCPKCMSYFFLKRGGAPGLNTPVVEHIVPDGSYDVSKKPLAPPPPHLKPPEPIAIDENDFDEPIERVGPTPEGLTFSSNTNVTEKMDLIDLPPDPPKGGPLDRLFLPIALLMLGALVAIVLNLRGIIQLPFLKQPSSVPPIPTYIPGQPFPSPTEPKSKFGFPKVDSEYDPWTGEKNKGTHN